MLDSDYVVGADWLRCMVPLFQQRMGNGGLGICAATLVSDAHTTDDQTEWGAPPPEKVIAHTNLYWTHHTAPGRTAGTVEAADVDFGAAS